MCAKAIDYLAGSFHTPTHDRNTSMARNFDLGNLQRSTGAGSGELGFATTAGSAQTEEESPETAAQRPNVLARKIYGYDFRERIRALGIEEVLTAPASPWQQPFVERLIGSVRRDCLDHVVVLGERHLRKILKSYFDYYHRSRTHLGLAKDAPESRAVQPPILGAVIELPEVGGLHHRYERRVA
jgi:Integrase core domain